MNKWLINKNPIYFVNEGRVENEKYETQARNLCTLMTGIGSILGSGWLFGAWKAAKISGGPLSFLGS